MDIESKVIGILGTQRPWPILHHVLSVMETPQKDLKIGSLRPHICRSPPAKWRGSDIKFANNARQKVLGRAPNCLVYTA